MGRCSPPPNGWSGAWPGRENFFERLIVFLGGIALPLVSRQFGMTSREQGLLTAATLLAILLGALITWRFRIETRGLNLEPR
jgi:hypothetical protein